MASAFRDAMSKLATLGNERSRLIDCSEVIPVPPPFTGSATLPAGQNQNDIEQAVSAFLLLVISSC